MELVDRGMSITEIAEAVGLSKATVRYWLRRHDLSTRATERMATERMARDAGQADLILICRRHGETRFVIEGSGY